MCGIAHQKWRRVAPAQWHGEGASARGAAYLKKNGLTAAALAAHQHLEEARGVKL